MKHFYKNIGTKMFNFADVYSGAVARCRTGGMMVEVGSWVGESLAYLIVEASNARKQIRVVSVDAFLGNVHGGAEVKERPQWEDFRRNLAPVWPCVTAIKALSVPAAAFFQDLSCDFVFIDADHHYEAVVADLRAWWPKVAEGGILAGHDVHHEPIRQALNEFVVDKGLVGWSTASTNCWTIRKG